MQSNPFAVEDVGRWAFSVGCWAFGVCCSILQNHHWSACVDADFLMSTNWGAVERPIGPIFTRVPLVAP
jgi:hypothetical protein